MNQKVFKPKPGSKINSPALVSMRETAYGNGMKVFLHRTDRHSDSVRDDEGMQEAAEAKRLRRQLKRGGGL